MGKTDNEKVGEMMKRIEANDAGAVTALADFYYNGKLGLLRDQKKGRELLTRAADLGHSQAHCHLGNDYFARRDVKKAKFHYETAAMAGHEEARRKIGVIESKSGNMERAVKHSTIAASAGNYAAMHNLLIALEDCDVSRESVDSTLAAYNASCAEMRSEARDAFIQLRFIQLSIYRNGAS
jgi:TPR repeat protein